MSVVEPRPTLTVEVLPPFPRKFLRLPVRVRLTPERGFWVAGMGCLRFEWSKTGDR